jgi:hypothetical protein
MFVISCNKYGDESIAKVFIACGLHLIATIVYIFEAEQVTTLFKR